MGTVPIAEDVILRDGTTLRLRAPVSQDAGALADFFSRLSERSLYLRFHGIRKIDESAAAAFADPDWEERGAFVGDLGGRIVALASYARLRDRETAEAAFAVEDELQGRGIGTRLLERLAARAGDEGISCFVAEVLPENRAMLGVFEDAGFATKRELAGGVTEVRLAIKPTASYVERVDERDHAAVAASLSPFFAPHAVAVVGASRRRGSIGGELFRNVLAADFEGAAYPVNRDAASVAGVRGYSSVGEIPEEIDLAVVCLPGAAVLPAAEDALAASVRALCVISAGFAETGPEGAERQRRLLELVRAHGARLVGPNCLGIAVAAPRLNATFGPRALPPGNVGFSSQSGALGLALLEQAGSRSLGFSAFVSIGNKADVSSNDLLEYWEDDPDTAVIALYLESFGNPRKFARIARRVGRKKPIVAMKSGTTRAGAKAASSHTAALADTEAAVDVLFQQAGVVRARTLEELADAATLLSRAPLPRGNRVALLTNAGGLGILCADACEAAGLELSEPSPATQEALRSFLPAEASVTNPVDMLGSATGASYEQALPPLLADPRVDAVIALFVPPVHATADEAAAAIARASRDAAKPVLAVVMSAGGTPAVLAETPSVATFAYPESAARALGLAAERAAWLRRRAGVVPELDGIASAARAALAGVEDGWLDTGQTRELLSAYGIPLVSERKAETLGEAVAAAVGFGFPVVTKTALAGVHKSESGGVALDLRSEQQVRQAVERIGLPVLVQPHVQGGAELLAGVVQDQVFGPLVAFGPGGVFAELMGEAGFRLAPLTDVDTEELVLGGKAGKLVRGFRGARPANAGALVDLLHRLSRLAEELPEIAELDLNPVIALPDRCVAVDARVRVRRQDREPQLKSW